MKKLALLFFVSFTMLTSNVNAQVNLAKGKKATQSSKYNTFQGHPSLAVDGNIDGNWFNKSVTHTKGGGTENPWWQVDLGSVKSISKIEIWNRTDCCKERLKNLFVHYRLSKNMQWKTYGLGGRSFTNGTKNPMKYIKDVKARYIMVRLEDPNGILSLAEVKVFEKEKDPNAKPEIVSWSTYYEVIDGITYKVESKKGTANGVKLITTRTAMPDGFVIPKNDTFGITDNVPSLVKLNFYNTSDWTVRYTVKYQDENNVNKTWKSGEIIKKKSKEFKVADNYKIISVKADFKDLLTWKNVTKKQYSRSAKNTPKKFLVTGSIGALPKLYANF